jgi:hypothetical protein
MYDFSWNCLIFTIKLESVVILRYVSHFYTLAP